MTKADVDFFVEVMTYFILSGISPIGNNTTPRSWTFTGAFATSTIIVFTIGYGTVFPRTSGGQMFCVAFATVGIPLTIIFLKHVGKLDFMPFEKLGKYLEQKGVNEKNASLWKITCFIICGSLLFLILPSFVFMSVKNWTYMEGIYYTFSTITAVGSGDYTIISNPLEEKESTPYLLLLLIWNLNGLVWIAVMFNLITSLFYAMESKLTKDTSEKEDGEERTQKRSQVLKINMLSKFPLSELHSFHRALSKRSDQDGGTEKQPDVSPEISPVSCTSTSKLI